MGNVLQVNPNLPPAQLQPLLALPVQNFVAHPFVVLLFVVASQLADGLLLPDLLYRFQQGHQLLVTYANIVVDAVVGLLSDAVRA